jgi:hypothetical protein
MYVRQLKRLVRGSLGLLLGVSLGSCVVGADRADTAGVPRWTLGPEPEFEVGAVEGDPRYLFSRIRSLTLLPDGGVLVADREGVSLRTFDDQGRSVAAWGRVGDGPGEFRYIWSTWLAEPDTVLVYDSSQYRVSMFGLDGALRATLPMRGEDGPPEVHAGRMSDGQHVIGWIRRLPRGPADEVTVDQMQVGIFGTDGALQRVLASGFGMRRLAGPLPFSPYFHAAMVGDSVLVSDGLDGTIDLVGPDGGLVRSFDVGLTPVSPDFAWESLLSSIDDDVVADGLRAMRDEPTADSIPVFSDLLTDDEGRVWVKAYDPSTDSHRRLRRRTGGEWTVLTTAGSTVARVHVPDGFRPMDIRSGRVAGVTWDELDVQRVRVYRIAGL